MLEAIGSRRALRAAFERVRENGGCRGADGMTVGDFAADLERQLDRLEASLLRRSYHPLPLLRFPVPKKGGGQRFLSVPAVRDRVVQTAVYDAVYPLFEAEFENVSFAFRPGRSVRQAVHRVAELRDAGFRFVVDADLDDFFASLPHEPLFARLRRMDLAPDLLRLLELWVRVEVYDGRSVTAFERGIPQGSVVSPMLANLFLDSLDENLALFGQTVVRYADDFLVLCKTSEARGEVLELTDYLVAELELVLHREKTRLTSFDEGFRFLGAVFLKDAIYLPFETTKPEDFTPQLPPPLDLTTYLDLRQAGRRASA
jgi:group II intron reverse transcriptase/maturase